MCQTREPKDESNARPPAPSREDISRRQFLVTGALTVGAASFAGRVCATGANDGIDAKSIEEAPLPDIVQARSDEAVTPRGLHEGVLLDLVHIVLNRLTGKSPKDAWRALLRDDDVIALKFNRSGADELGTTNPMLNVLVQSLTAAGFKAGQLVSVEVSPAIRAATGTTAPRDGWSANEVDFSSGRDRLAAWLDQVTAIINVPFLKTHNLAGLTCCLKNLSHAVVKHPAQFHANGCSPYIADIAALPEVKGKVRLHLVNALRVVFDGGPEATEDNIWDAGMVVGGFDPVALDAVGLQTIEQARAMLRLPRLVSGGGPPPYLLAAGERGLGRVGLHQVRVDKVKL